MKHPYPITLIIASLLFLIFLYGYYGYAGLETILVLPFTVVLIFISGIISGLVIKRLDTVKEKRTVLLVSLAIIILVISSIHPTDGGIKPSEYFIQYLKAQIARESIAYSNYYDEGKNRLPFKKIAMSRYKEQLPDRAIMVHYYQSEKVEWEDRVRIAFEKRSNNWSIVKLSNGDIQAGIEQIVSKNDSEIFKITINNKTFTEKYYPPTNGQNSYYYSQDSKWKDGEPRIIVFEWGR